MKIQGLKKIVMLCTALTLTATLAACSTQKAPEKTQEGYTVATMKDVEKGLKDEKTVVIDARSNNEYIGWALNGAKRGGHIKGATDFSASWLTSEYDDKKNLEGDTRQDVLKYTLENKKITPDKNIIIYDTNKKDSKNVAKYLMDKGIKNISIYDANEWINSNKDMDSYKNYAKLVPASVVKDLTDGKTVENIDNKNLVIVDVRWGNSKESGYLDGHIPKAVHVNTDSFEPPHAYVDGIEEWRLTDDKSLVKLLLDNGITSETTVISTSPEPMAASRFAVICEYLGVKDVRVLNGGLVDWKAQGYELDKTDVKPVAQADFKASYPKNPKLITTMAQLKEKLNKKEDFNLVDNRTIEEYEGKVSGYSYHKKMGRIPTAKYGLAGKKNSSSMCYYRNIDKTIRNATEIQDMWKQNGIDTTKNMTYMCGSGWRAAEVLWYAQVMGFEDVSLYSDGWIAWSNEKNPSETGAVEK